jgi:hypothetical protein
MDGLTGLTPVSGVYVAYVDRPEATPEERLGKPVNPRHAILKGGQKPSRSQQTMAGSHGPYGPENQLLGDPGYVWESAGTESDDPYMDLTPSTHAAPYPKGVASGRVPGETADDIGEQLRQSRAIHAIDKGASRKMVTTQQGDLNFGQWVELWEINPGSVDQADLASQYKSSGFLFGTTDRNQSFARQNQYGFDSKHMHRRYADAPVPGNYMYLQPGERPMVKHSAGTARLPVGPSSPFAGDDTGFNFAPYGALLQDQPTAYIPPPQPNIAPATITNDDNPGIDWY